MYIVFLYIVLLYIVIHSSYVLTDQEYKALSYGLDHHIPTSSRYNAIETEFKFLYQNILKNISHIPDVLTQLKTKVRSTCHKYSKIRVLYKYQTIINNLSKNTNSKIHKQDQDGGVVLSDSSKYTEKGLSKLDNAQFVKINDDPTKRVEAGFGMEKDGNHGKFIGSNLFIFCQGRSQDLNQPL